MPARRLIPKHLELEALKWAAGAPDVDAPSDVYYPRPWSEPTLPEDPALSDPLQEDFEADSRHLAELARMGREGLAEANIPEGWNREGGIHVANDSPFNQRDWDIAQRGGPPGPAYSEGPDGGDVDQLPYWYGGERPIVSQEDIAEGADPSWNEEQLHNWYAFGDPEGEDASWGQAVDQFSGFEPQEARWKKAMDDWSAGGGEGPEPEYDPAPPVELPPESPEVTRRVDDAFRKLNIERDSMWEPPLELQQRIDEMNRNRPEGTSSYEEFQQAMEDPRDPNDIPMSRGDKDWKIDPKNQKAHRDLFSHPGNDANLAWAQVNLDPVLYQELLNMPPGLRTQIILNLREHEGEP